MHTAILLFLPLLGIEEIDGLVLEDLPLFYVPKVGAEALKRIFRTHREPSIVV